MSSKLNLLWILVFCCAVPVLNLIWESNDHVSGFGEMACRASEK